MISVAEGIKIVEKHTEVGEVKTKSVSKCYGLVLAEDILSPINMPPFRQSSMDGYAFIFSEEKEYTLIGEVQAGFSKNIALKKREIVRIFTGARVPNQADTVVMQENCSAEKSTITLNELPKKGANVRPLGEQLKKDEVALTKGTFLNEAAIGFLTGLGIEKIKVFNTPKVSILITGNELKQPGTNIKEGEVYDSNSITLKLALQKLGIKKIEVEQVSDDLPSTIKTIKKHLEISDVLLISGGISVGDYDFVKEALLKNGAEELFYKINQKPGKPLWFGEKGSKKIFALPGNPASSLTCYYVYVYPALRKMMGHSDIHLPRNKAIVSEGIKNNSGKDLFLKGNVIDGKAELLKGQASSMLKSFAVCNALLMVPSEVESIQKNEEITYIDLNYSH